MSQIATMGGAGELLREWRNRRRMSQLDLALEAGVSARHLSFVETGRSRPSPEHLQVPLREQNALLLAAGFAPVFSETSLENEEMEPVRRALDAILTGHEPYPAVIVDREWEIVASNAPARMLLEGVSEELLAPPLNALRITLHPDGLASRIANFQEWSEHLLTRLHRQALLSQDPALAELERELLTYPGVERASGVTEPAEMLFVPLQLRLPSGAEWLTMSLLLRSLARPRTGDCTLTNASGRVRRPCCIA